MSRRSAAIARPAFQRPMAETGGCFPAVVDLNEVDHFLLQLDHTMGQGPGRANVCTFVVTLRGHLALETLRRRIEADPAYRWLTRLRLSGGLLRRGRWREDGRAGLPALRVRLSETDEGVPPSLLATELDVRRESPLKIDLLHQGKECSRLIFTWHHALMDAHGGEFLIRHLGTGQARSPFLRQPPCPSPLSWRQRGEIAREMKTDLYETAKPPLLVLHRKERPAGALRYQVMRFSSRETRMIEGRARAHGAAFLTSAFYLAAAACALATLKRRRGDTLEDVLVPVPQDRRRRGAAGPIIGNQVSFLFYRIPAGALGDLARCTAEVVAQTRAFIRSGMTDRYLVMMGLLRYLPGPLYRALLRSPTQGEMGSCFLSDTGEILGGCKSLFGHEVLEAVHYPPNIHPPGLTFVFGRFRGALQVTLASMGGVVDVHESECLLAALRRNLLGEVGDAL